MTTKEKQIVEKKNELEVSTFISKAIEQKLPVESMERLFALYERAKAEKAKEAYIEALANFQKNCPIITKDKKVMNKDGRTVRYVYAPLESEIKQIGGLIADNNFSYSWNTKNTEEKMEVVCHLTHSLGHTESSTFTIPIEKSQYMTHPQSYASAQTFAKRYTLNNVLGIATAEEDDDSLATENGSDVKSKKSKIILLLRRLEFETDTKEQIETAVKEKTGLKLEEKSYDKIIETLSKVVREVEDDILYNEDN
jgi:hypothetical protein